MNPDQQKEKDEAKNQHQQQVEKWSQMLLTFNKQYIVLKQEELKMIDLLNQNPS